MRIIFTAALWFLAAWVCVDITCFALGWPRQATPLVATLVGMAVAARLANIGRLAEPLSIRGRSTSITPRKV